MTSHNKKTFARIFIGFSIGFLTSEIGFRQTLMIVSVLMLFHGLKLISE